MGEAVSTNSGLKLSISMHQDGDRVQDNILEEIIKKYETVILNEYQMKLRESSVDIVNVDDNNVTNDIFDFDESDSSGQNEQDS